MAGSSQSCPKWRPSHQLITRIADQLPLGNAAEAHTRLAGGGIRGKLVLIPWPSGHPLIQRATATSDVNPKTL
jgi:hypothetical protein